MDSSGSKRPRLEAEPGPSGAGPSANANAQQNLELLGEYLLKRDFYMQTHETSDHYLARWQARQLAKGFVDNTINRVLDSWSVAPLLRSPEIERRLVFDVADYFDRIEDDDSVENEGILMAISAHGLRNRDDDSPEPVPGPSREDSRNCDCGTSHEVGDRPPPIPFHRRTATDTTVRCERNRVPISVRDSLDERASSPIPSDSEDSSSSTANVDDKGDGSDRFEDHFDFMDAAVSFAIQNKGLTSFGGVDYG